MKNSLSTFCLEISVFKSMKIITVLYVLLVCENENATLTGITVHTV